MKKSVKIIEIDFSLLSKKETEFVEELQRRARLVKPIQVDFSKLSGKELKKLKRIQKKYLSLKNHY